MKNTILSALALGAAPLLTAQQELRVAGLDIPTQVTWGQDTEDGQAAIRYDELPDEHTLLMVHTTVDESVAGPLLTAGISSLLPFMATPDSGSWTLTHPSLLAIEEDYEFSGDPPKIPPGRIANYVQAFVAANYGTGYGTNNVGGSAWIERTTYPGMVAPPTLKTDERWSWANTTWNPITSLNLSSFGTANLGRQSVIQAAYEFHSQNPHLPPISEQSLEQLNDLLDQKIGFEIYVQAMHIKPPSTPTGKITVRVSRYARIRRRSLLQLQTEWFLHKGYERHVPSMFIPDQRWYLGPLGDEMQIEFPFAVGTIARPAPLIAYIMTTSGMVTVPQTPNPLSSTGELLNPNVALFQVPLDAIAQIAYVAKSTAPLTPVLPVGAANDGFWLIPFVVPQATNSNQ